MSMQRKHMWMVGGTVVGLFLLSSKRTFSTGAEISVNARDIDNTARMLVAETGFVRDKNEMAQIVWVAINRARGKGKTLSEVTTPPGNPLWNGSALYRQLFEKALHSSKLPAAREFVKAVLAGEWPEVIGGRRMFLHPGGMPVPPCASNRVQSSTTSGTRCVPEWALNGKVVGGAIFA